MLGLIRGGKTSILTTGALAMCGRVVRYVRWGSGEEALRILCGVLGLGDVCSRVRVVASTSSSSALARVWGLHRVFQEAMSTGPIYVVEVVWRNFSKLGCEERVDVLLHELAHIPSRPRGGVRPHNRAFYSSLELYRRAIRRAGPDIAKRLCELLSKPPSL